MRKLFMMFAAFVMLGAVASVVSAAEHAPAVPDGVAAYIVESGVCDDKINFDSNDKWGNGSRVSGAEFVVAGSAVAGQCRFPVSDIGDLEVITSLYCPGKINYDNPNWGNIQRFKANGDFIIAGEAVAGRCTIPGGAVPAQVAVDAYCKDGQVNTSRSNWGNASRIKADGSLKISGEGVAGHCTITKAAGIQAISLIIPKWQ